jgi:diacylglycerol O-acyltransferase / wax synthase
VPLTRNLTVVVGILSYDGTMHFGLWADRDLFGDLEVFAGGIDDAFAELLKQAREKEQK